MRINSSWVCGLLLIYRWHRRQRHCDSWFSHLCLDFFSCRAKRTIADFVKTYFPLHGMKPEEFLDYWDLLVFVEGTIYQLDEINEHMASGNVPKNDNSNESPPITMSMDPVSGMNIIKEVLQSCGLLSDALKGELDNGLVFWERERTFCASMGQHSCVPVTGQDPPLFSLHDVHAAAKRKSFDYRVMNLLLYGLTKTSPDPQLLDFLLVDEMLVDIGDDLYDYEEDCCDNCFNIYRLYVHLFGKEAPLRLVERISALETEHAELLSGLDSETQAFYQRRMVGAAEGPGALRWTIPSPILDEGAFRAEFSSTSSIK